MSSIVVLLALTLLATGCWYTHHWSGTHEHERNQWNNQLHTLQTARITLAAGDYATLTIRSNTCRLHSTRTS